MTKWYRKLKSTALTGVMITAVLAGANMAQAREMRVSSFEPAQGFFSGVLQQWIDIVNPLLSDGNSFKLYPGSILGSPPAQQQLVRTGVADIAFIVPSYTPGLFPLSSVNEIPGLTSTSKNGTEMLHTLLEEGLLGQEYDEFKIISLISTRSYKIFMKEAALKLPSDLEDKRMRSHSRFASRVYASLGSSGVSIPAPQVYENLERGILDGAAWVFDGYATFRLNEVASHVSIIPGGFSGASLAFLMNEKTYNSLPDADKKVIDEHSGLVNSLWVANLVDETGSALEAKYRADPKVNVYDIKGDELAAWKKAFANTADDWVESLKEFNVDATPTLKRAHEIVNQ